MLNNRFKTFLFFLCITLTMPQQNSGPRTEMTTVNIKNLTNVGTYLNYKSPTKRQYKVLGNYYVSKVYVDPEEGSYYYTTLYIGKNKSPQTYILDTGSPIMSSPCTACRKCGKHTNPYYDEESSSKAISLHSTKCSYLIDTNKKKSAVFNPFKRQCTFNVSYSEGSTISGYYTNQLVYFPNLLGNTNDYSKPFTLPIGCTTEEKNSFYEQKADGVLGLSNRDKSFMNMLFETDTIRLNLFSLCFYDKGGYFALGRVDRTYHKSRVIRFVPILSKTNYYNIRIMQIIVGVKSLYNNNVAVIDTGNTVTYFPKYIYDKVLFNFNTHCEQHGTKCGTFRNTEKYGHCATFENETDLQNALNYWPIIYLILDGLQYRWNANDYYYKVKINNQLNACLGFNVDNSQKITLGANFIHGYDVIFDRYHQKIGFVRADCSRTNKTYIFSETIYTYDSQRPKPIPLIQRHQNTTDDDDDDDDEETILDEFDDGRKKKAPLSEYIMSGIIIVGVIVLIIVILCKSGTNIKGYKKELFNQLDVETSSLQKEREELKEYKIAKVNKGKKY